MREEEVKKREKRIEIFTSNSVIVSSRRIIGTFVCVINSITRNSFDFKFEPINSNTRLKLTSCLFFVSIKRTKSKSEEVSNAKSLTIEPKGQRPLKI